MVRHSGGDFGRSFLLQAMVMLVGACLDVQLALAQELATAGTQTSSCVAPDPHPDPYYGSNVRDDFALPMLDGHSHGVGRPLVLPKWFARARALPIGGLMKLVPQDREELRSMRALGFTRVAVDRFRKEVDLLATENLAYFDAPGLPSVDAVAVISIHRPQVKQQYIYQTLRSMFAEFPPEVVINVLVGSAEVGYLSAAKLTAELGADYAQRVHVLAGSAAIARHFADNHYSVPARATWNYARALRSYRGKSSLMVFEDDVQFAKNAVEHLVPWLTYRPSNALFLFNALCHLQLPLWQQPGSAFGIEQHPVRQNLDFATLQGVLLSREIANEAGDFIAFRADRETHDYMLARFLSHTTGGFSLVYPSALQHIGLTTTGLSGEGWLPISRCFQAELPTGPH